MTTADGPLASSMRTGVRTSQPSNFSPYVGGGSGTIVRRGVDPAIDLTSAGGVAALYEGNALRLLKMLPDIHPMFDKELWNVLNLACAPGDLTVAAVIDDGNGEEHDDATTASLNALWASLPSEIGGLVGLQRQLTQEGMLTGLPCVEAVPGPTLTGVSLACPVDSLTVVFKRNPDYSVAPFQKQIGSRAANDLVALDPRTFFWRAMNPMVDNPYGRPPLGVALHECLGDIAMIADLHRAVHVVGSPRLDQSFDFQESVNFAVTTLKMKPKDANDWAYKQFMRAREIAMTLRADDVLLHDKNIDTKVLDGAKGFNGLEKVLEFLRHRIIVALKSMPTLMGVNDGSTQTYTTVEWAIYAAGLESVRGLVVDLIEAIANLHLRLIGSKAKAKVTTKPIRTTDNLVEAQTETMRIANERTKFDCGLIGPEEFAKNVTGSGPYDLKKLNGLGAASAPTSVTSEAPNPNGPVKFPKAAGSRVSGKAVPA